MAKIKSLTKKTSDRGVIHLSNLCTEILEVTSSGKKVQVPSAEITPQSVIDDNIRVTGYDPETNTFTAIKGSETAVCNLGSINIGRGYIKNGKLDKEKLRKNVATAVKFLDRVIDRNFYPIHESLVSNDRWRPVGLGLMGLADFFFQLRMPFDSAAAIQMSSDISEEIYYQALKTSCELAKVSGPHKDFHLTKASQGILQFDMVGIVPADVERWNELKADIMKYGLRNSLLIAIAPTATISHIVGVEECIEPIKSNLLKRETLSGEFVSINKYLVEDLKKLKLWDTSMLEKLILNNGSVKAIEGLPQELYDLYKDAWEYSQKAIIGHAAARGAWIDQSQSVNLFLDLNKHAADKRLGVLSSMYMMAWKEGLKTTYYLRSKSASNIKKTTVQEHVASSIEQLAPENPEICESCT